jgi:hypothetical protein
MLSFEPHISSNNDSTILTLSSQTSLLFLYKYNKQWGYTPQDWPGDGLTSENAGAHIFLYLLHSCPSVPTMFGPKKETISKYSVGFSNMAFEERTSYYSCWWATLEEWLHFQNNRPWLQVGRPGTGFLWDMAEWIPRADIERDLSLRIVQTPYQREDIRVPTFEHFFVH